MTTSSTQESSNPLFVDIDVTEQCMIVGELIEAALHHFSLVLESSEAYEVKLDVSKLDEVNMYVSKKNGYAKSDYPSKSSLDYHD